MASATAIPNKPPTEIYIGGAADEASGLVLGYAEARRQFTAPQGRIVHYFPHYRAAAALRAARSALSEGRALALIGHSWGADSALRVAERLEGNLLLIGADPVAKPALPVVLWRHRPASARYMLHVDASAEARDRSDHVKTVGYLTGGGVHRAWREADRVILARLNHWNFSGMMSAPGDDGISAERLLAEMTKA